MHHPFFTSCPWKACLGLLVAGVLFSHTEAKAASLNGSLALVGIKVSQNKANLSLSDKIDATFMLTSNSGTGAFSVIPFLTTFIPTQLNLNTLSTFSFSNALWGTFVANEPSSANQILQQTASFLDVLMDGTFTPGPSLLAINPGYVPSEEILRISLNQSGQSLSEAVTMNSPVPEPGTLLLLGSGLVALAASHKQFAKR